MHRRPAGAALALGRFPGGGSLLAVANTGMGLPPVVVGLFVTVLLWRSGPLGGLGLLYTPDRDDPRPGRDRDARSSPR